MTPQERQLVDELFDRLSSLENAPRDPEAERAIVEGTQRAPHAIYALVQTALVQDEALKRANAQIEALQAQVGEAEQTEPQQQRSFLDSMRSAFGRPEPRGSVPSVSGPASASRPMPPQMQAAAPMPSPQGAPMPPPQGPYAGGGAPGGSFLGNAASAAAGVIGGALLLDGIRSMFGHGPGIGALDPFGRPSEHAAPLGGSSSEHALPHDVALEDRNHDRELADQSPTDDHGRLWDASDEESADDSDFADDADFGGDDTDYA
jgi:uncharacterized protein